MELMEFLQNAGGALVWGLQQAPWVGLGLFLGSFGCLVVIRAKEL